VKRFLVSLVTLAVLAVSGFAIWRAFDERAKAAKIESEILKGLTEKQLADVLKSEAAADRKAIAALKENAEKRQMFLQGMRETLALAAQARREGFADNEKFKINLEYKEKLLIADLYQVKLSEGKDKFFVVPEEELQAVWKNPANEKHFQTDMRVLREIRLSGERARGNNYPIPALAGDALGKARKNWARTKILSEMAQNDKEFINQPAIPLRFKILEAGILANDYLRENLTTKINAGEAEINDYLKTHPEYDVKKKLEKAGIVLTKVKAGEDFEKLAKEYSEDRGSLERGGLYEDVRANVLWQEVEQAALKLQPGEITDFLVESELGFHIVKLVKKNNPQKEDKSDLRYSVRHIVVQKKFEEPGDKIPGIPKPFLNPQEIARAEVEKTKRKKFIDEIINQNPISLPKDFAVVLPEIKKVTKQATQGE
jgi:hypothetical protein